MDSCSGPLDCKVLVRKYVLIAQPSRWRAKGLRVVVYSPMLHIGTSVSEVPVRCYRGEWQNDVGFIPKSDIEKDTSNVYEKSYVNKASLYVNAHGVAAFDSDLSDTFKYKRGQHFWICIGPNTNGYKDTVPVVNLQTFQTGNIRVDQVRWTPKLRGPGTEVWTLGGSRMSVKLAGPGNWKHYSWAICQYTDGRPPTTRTHVEIPAEKSTTSRDGALLSSHESQNLFNLQCEVMDGNTANRHPLTPPASPASQAFSASPKPYVLSTEPGTISSAESYALRRIFKIAKERRSRKGESYVLRRSTIHPQPDGYSTLHNKVDSPAHTDKDLEDCDRLGSDFKRRQCEGMKHRAVTRLLDLWRDDNSNNMSLTNRATRHDPDVISREYWESQPRKHNPLLDNLCDLKDQNCPYITKFTFKHFHSPPSKCRLAAPINSYTGLLKSNHDENPVPFHEDHCISEDGPYPHTAGGCLLADSPTSHPNHKCCKWDDADMKGLSVMRQYEENIKVTEARRRGMTLHDRSKQVSKMKPDFNVEDDENVTMDEGGRGLLNACYGGDYDDQVGELGSPKSTFDDDTEDWNTLIATR